MPIFKFSFGLSYEYQTVKLNDVLTPERFSFILIAVVIHHFTLFILEIFPMQTGFWSDSFLFLSVTFKQAHIKLLAHVNHRWMHACSLPKKPWNV